MNLGLERLSGNEAFLYNGLFGECEESYVVGEREKEREEKKEIGEEIQKLRKIREGRGVQKPE